MDHLYGLIVLAVLLPLALWPVIEEFISQPLTGVSQKARKRVKNAKELGIIPEHFVRREAGRSITGDDLIAIFYNVFRRIAYEVKPTKKFTDIATSFQRDQIISRARCAEMIAKVAEAFDGLYFEGSPEDFGDIEDYPQKDAIAFAVKIGAMETVGYEGHFVPCCDVTMEEAILAAERLVRYAGEKYN